MNALGEFSMQPDGNGLSAPGEMLHKKSGL